MTDRTRVLFLIPSLASGGAERQLCELTQHLDRARFEVHVATFYAPGEGNDGLFWDQLAGRRDMSLHCLHKRRGMAGFLTAIPKLLALGLRIRPHLVHGYTDGNAPALLVGRLLGARVIWGIRRTSGDPSKLNARSITFRKWFILGSRFVDMIIFNSEAGRANHLRMGWSPREARVVPNGFDVARFAPDPAAGAARRETWGVPEGVPLIGISGRLHPVKDHPTFLRAAAGILAALPEAHFVCIGHGSEPYANQLRNQAESLGLGARVHWAGRVEDMRSAYNALSLLMLTSTDEGFPNVLGEAMACGVPCVATRVGDAAPLVGDTGTVVASGDVEGLVAGALGLLREEPPARAARSAACRTRIVETFSVEALALNTQVALEDALAGRRSGKG